MPDLSTRIREINAENGANSKRKPKHTATPAETSSVVENIVIPAPRDDVENLVKALEKKDHKMPQLDLAKASTLVWLAVGVFAILALARFIIFGL